MADEPIAPQAAPVQQDTPTQPEQAPVAQTPVQPQGDQPQQQDPITDRAKKLYDGLTSIGVTDQNIGGFDNLNKALHDPDRASKLYDGLISIGVTADNIGDKKSFLSKFQAEPNLGPGFASVNAAIFGDNKQDKNALTPVIDKTLKAKIQNDNQTAADRALLEDTHQKVQHMNQLAATSDNLRNIYNSLPSSKKKQWDQAADLMATKKPDQLNETTPDEVAHFKFMDSTLGRTLGAVGTVASDATHGVVQIGKMGTFLLSKLSTDPSVWITDNKPDFIKSGEEAADKFADMGWTGMTQNDLQTAHDTPLLGTASQVAPIAATEGIGQLTKLPKLMFFLQMGGSGIDAVNDIKKSGVNVDPLVENVFPLLTGAVGALAMGNVGETLFGKLPGEAASKLSSVIGAETFMEASQKKLTEDAFADLLKNKTQTYLQKLQQGTLNIANAYKSTVLNLSKFQAGNYLAKEAANDISSADGYKQPFKQNLGDLANSLYNVVVKDAPIFAGFGQVKELYTMAAPHTAFKNEIVQKLLQDSSPEAVDSMKKQLYDYGFNDELGDNKWTPQQMQSTYETVDKIATAANSAGKKLNPDVREKVVGLLASRNELVDQMNEYNKQNGNVDDSLKETLTPEQQTYQNKIDQANDKLNALIQGGAKGKVKYSADENGKSFYKEFPDGTREKVTDSRYAMEQNEKDGASQSMYKDENPGFTNYAKSVGVTEQSDGDQLSSDSGSAVDIKLSPSKNKSTVYIDHIEVPEETRGLGLAKEKLGELGDKADEQGVTLSAHVGNDEKLTKLFEGAGFEKEGEFVTRQPKEIQNESSSKEGDNQGSVIEESTKENGSQEVGQEQQIKPEETGVPSQGDANGNISPEPDVPKLKAKYQRNVKKLSKEGISEDDKINILKEQNDISGQIKAYKESKIKSDDLYQPAPDNGVSAAKMAVLDDRIKTVSKSLSKKLKGGLNSTGPFHALPELVELGKLYAQKGILKFSDFVKELRAEYTKRTGKDLPLTDKEIAKDIYKPAMRSLVDPKAEDEVKERGFGKRLSGQVPEETQTYIDTDPEHDYTKQTLSDIKNDTEIKATQELLGKTDTLSLLSTLNSDTNTGVLAAGELLKRALATGDESEYTRIFKILDAAGTSLGQMLRQYAEIKGSTPEFFISALEKKMEQSGRFLTDEQKTELHDLMGDYFGKALTAKDSWLHAVETLDKDDYDIAVKARKEADMAHIELNKKISKFDISGFWDTAITIMKGNLLSISSQIANPVYNIMFAPLRIGTKAMASVFDLIASKVFGTERTTTYEFNQLHEQMAGFIEGINQAGLTIRHGLYPNSETKVGDYRGLQPLDAWVQIFTGADIPKSDNPAQYFKDRFLTKPLEAIFGGPAEAMYRMLSLGDKPFYQSALRNKLAELANLKNLEGDERKRFLMNPDPESQAEAVKAANEATFQDDTKATKILTTFDSLTSMALNDKNLMGIGGPVKFALAAIKPFVKTPTNVIMEGLSYLIPEVSYMQAGISAVHIFNSKIETKTKLERAEENGASKATIDKIKVNAAKDINSARKDLLTAISKAVVARTLQAGASWVVGNGLYTGSLEDDKKKRGLQYEAGRPNSVNVTALNRGMQTGSYDWQPGDDFISMDKFGMFGAAIAVRSNIVEGEKKDDQTGDYLTDLAYSAPAVVKNSLDQSFLKGINSMMDAIATGRYDQIASNTVSSMSSVALPNTWSSFARANREFMVNKKGATTGESIANVIKEKAFFDPKLPSQIGLWGQDVKQTPDGRNPYVYQLLDITKFNTLADDPVTSEVVSLYKRTDDDSFIPQKPDGNYMIMGTRFKLTPEEISIRQRLVGEQRYMAYAQVIGSQGYRTEQNPHIRSMSLNEALTISTRIGDLKFEDYYIKQHSEVKDKIEAVKKGEIKNK